MSLSTDVLQQLIDAKHQVLVQLRDLGSRQSQLIEQGDMGELLKLLATKQRVIETLQSVEQRIRPFRNEAPDSRVWRSPDDRAKCAAVADACQLLLDDIVETEKRNESKMVAQRDGTAARLKTAHAANRARAAYAVQNVHGPAPHTKTPLAQPTGQWPTAVNSEESS